MTAFGLTLIATWALAQPAVLNGQRIDRGEVTDVAGALGALGDGWGGYAVPRIAGHHQPCGGGGVVSLEGGGWQNRGELDSGGELWLFFDVRDGRVTTIRIAGEECRIDAGGREVSWWSGVSASESLTLLDELARTAGEDVAEDAVTAMALHAVGEADDALAALATSGASRDVREKAIFWLGASRGERGLERLSRLASSLDDTELREKVTFALHVSEAEGATERLVQMAKSDRSSEVRGKALFWLAQEAGDLASSAILDAVANDPDVELKEKAVFALSQLPPDEGVPLLIDVAETHPVADVRKKAMFWLGQSNDPRALALFERILLER